MSEDSGHSATGLVEEGASPCASPTPSLTPSLPASLPASTTPMIPTAPATPCSEHSAAASSASARSEIGEPLRPRLTANELDAISLTELVQNWKDLDVYTEWLDNQAASQEVENANLRQYLERVKQQHLEACSRERAVLRRLATKEQEIQELMAQITDLKTSATPSAGSLRAALLDPAVNLLLQKLRTELATSRAQLEETQNELSAWKFTPDSNTGKRLMAKCRLLYQENEELGKLVASGRMAKLEGELALQKNFSLEVKKSQSELDEFLQELDEDVEGMQSTVYYLQQELRKSRETISALERKLIKYKKFKKDGDDENDEDVSESEEPKEDWKETGDVEVEGEGWTEWKEGDNGDDDWNQWEEEEEERVNNYAEEEQPADWSEDNKDPSNIETLKLSGNAPKTGKVSLKRTKPSEGDLNDCFDSPVQKRLKTASLQAENTKDITIASGVNENKEAPADGKE